MPIPAPSGDNKLLRFGLFEVNLSAGELRKNGARVRLQEQPFQVLTVLLNNAGRVVTREDLRATIWPSDTFVDFDHSLNTAVNKIREALGDSASTPLFVETIPKRGYRFIAVIESDTATEHPPISAPPQPDPDSLPTAPRHITRALFA